MAASLVNCPLGPSAAAGRVPPPDKIKAAALSASAVDMREAILAAVASGTIEALKSAIELNELPPDVGQGPGEEPIAALKRQSIDGSARDVLDVLARLLDTDAALVPLGRDIENNGVYIWPYLAERDLTKLSQGDRAALDALVSTEAAAEMVRAGRWTWWRLAIGADGTWHAFTRGGGNK